MEYLLFCIFLFCGSEHWIISESRLLLGTLLWIYESAPDTVGTGVTPFSFLVYAADL